jgi:RNA polymerase sigma-70 factor (ECF subfamily)
VRNTAFTWLAKNRPKSVSLTGDAQLLEMAAANSQAASRNPEEALIATANEAALEAAIQALPQSFQGSCRDGG